MMKTPFFRNGFIAIMFAACCAVSCKKTEKSDDANMNAPADSTTVDTMSSQKADMIPAKDSTAEVPDTISTQLDAKTRAPQIISRLQENLKSNKHGSVIVGGKKMANTCVTVTFTGGDSGTICASDATVKEIEAECAKGKNCTVTAQ